LGDPYRRWWSEPGRLGFRSWASLEQRERGIEVLGFQAAARRSL
jgi:hypothetical protein